MPFDSWAEPSRLGNHSKKSSWKHISALIFLVKHHKPKTEKPALHLDGVYTVTLELLLLWSFESDASPAGDNTGN